MFKKTLTKLHPPNWLLLILILVFILRIPSFFEPYSYGDEMIYLTLGQGIRQGIPLYSGLHDNKPPFLYLLAAIAGNLFWFKAILAFWSLIVVVLFWRLTETLFPKKAKLQKVAVIIFALFSTLPLLEGNIANAENFMIGPIIAAFLILFSQKLNFKKLFFAGVLFSFAALFKIPAAFDFPVIVIFWLITSRLKKANFRQILKNTAGLCLGFALPIGLTLVWYFVKGAGQDYLMAAFWQNIGYLSSWRPGDTQKPFLIRNLPLLVRAGITATGSVVLFLSRKKLSRQFVLICLWLIFTLFAVTLSERPYPHYLLQSLAPVSLLLALFFSDKSREQSLTIIPLFLFFLVPVYYHYWLYPTSAYYQNFIQFALGQKSKSQYFSWFNPNIDKNYETADFLIKSSRPEEKVFIWSADAPAIYALARRFPPIKYVAPYHIKDFSNPKATVELLAQNPPKFIIITSNSDPLPELIPLLRTRYILIKKSKEVEIWSLLNSKS